MTHGSTILSETGVRRKLNSHEGWQSPILLLGKIRNVYQQRITLPRARKANVVAHPTVFDDHAGLLVNEPPGTAGLLFI